LNTLRNSWKAGKSTAAVAAMAAVLMLGAVPLMHADDHAKCQHNIEKAEARLDDAIRKHGERSGEASARRRDLDAERERCWNQYHGWWDGHAHQWHDQRDWDHDDHH
jgi:hypothetical protein